MSDTVHILTTMSGDPVLAVLGTEADAAALVWRLATGSGEEMLNIEGPVPLVSPDAPVAHLLNEEN